MYERKLIVRMRTIIVLSDTGATQSSYWTCDIATVLDERDESRASNSAGNTMPLPVAAHCEANTWPVQHELFRLLDTRSRGTKGKKKKKKSFVIDPAYDLAAFSGDVAHCASF